MGREIESRQGIHDSFKNFLSGTFNIERPEFGWVLGINIL
jgi:hypothetical protein